MERGVEIDEEAEHAAEAGELGSFAQGAQGRDEQHEAEQAQRPIAGEASDVFGGVGAEVVGEDAVDEPREGDEACYEKNSF